VIIIIIFSRIFLTLVEQNDGSKDVRLRLASPLDRETIDRYTMTVVAVDGGAPVPLSGSLLVEVEVGDANDHSPRFEGGDDNSTNYIIDVDENVAAMSPLIRIRAVDVDQGLNGEVTYGWAESTERAHGSIFGIDANTGQVYVKAHIDYEQEQVYQVRCIGDEMKPVAFGLQLINCL
jgi:protocadherin delta 1